MKNNLYKIIVCGVILLLGFLFFKGYLYKKEIEENKGQTICKYVLCKKFPRTTENFFTYYVDGKKYRNSYGNCPENYEKKIQQFFILYYSVKDVNKIEVDFSKQIKDTLAILRSGFQKEDLKDLIH
jgi:hypothetical protein